MPGSKHSAHSNSDLIPVYLGVRRNRLNMVWEDIKIPLLVGLGLLSVGLGTIGFQLYYSQTGESFNFGRSLYSALELLELRGGNLATPIPWELTVASWLAPAVAMYGVLLGLAAIFRDQFRSMRLRFTSNHVVICGLGQKGVLLARNFHASGHTVAVIENDGSNPYISAYREMGIIVIPGDARDEYTLRKAGVARAQTLIAVCGDDGANADVAVKARHMVSSRLGRKLNCAIHIKDPRLWVFLRRQEFSPAKDEAFRLDFFNIYDHGARQLLRANPLPAHTNGNQGKAPHLLIVGLENLGKQIVIHLVRQWYPLYEKNGSKLHISVVDPDAQKKIDGLCQDYSLVREMCEWSAYQVDFNCSEFHQAKFLEAKHQSPDITYIYVCLEDETVGLSSALCLLEQTQSSEIPILVRMTEDAGLASLLKDTKGAAGELARLHVFGLMERTCKPDFLNDGSHAALARAIHEEYVSAEWRKGNTPESNPSMVTWEQLNEELKEMNRDQADNIGIKIHSIGCDIVPWNDYGADKFAFTTDEVEFMAKMEHVRWCKLKLDQGWKYAEMRDDRKKLHPSLIDWEDARFREEEKEKDRNTVRQIPKFLALAGFQIYRAGSENTTAS
jgi:hypothetical protein